MNTDKKTGARRGAGARALPVECGDLSPLCRGDLSPSHVRAREFGMEHSRLAPAQACERGWAHSAVRRRPVACAKAVTSHRTPNRGGAWRAAAWLYPCPSVYIRGSRERGLCVWSAVTGHRFREATGRRRVSGGMSWRGGVHGSRQRRDARGDGSVRRFDGDKSPVQKR